MDDFCFDVQMLAMMTAVAFGGAGYIAVMLSVAARYHRTGGIVVYSIFLAGWVVIGAYIYISYCVDFLPRTELGRRLAPLLRALLPCLRGVAWLLRLPMRCLRSGVWLLRLPFRCARARLRRCATSSGDAGPALPRERQGMAVLAREPPVRGGAHVVAVVDAIPAYESDGGAQPDGASAECSVCLCEVDKGETMKRLPVCQHMFHQQCIDLWLRDNSTCPVCRRDVFAQQPAQMA